MTAGLLSLKWNNHQSTFINMLTDIRCKESLSDVTLTCGGKFYSLHKFVLSTCSEYFEKIFQKTAGKHPVVVLKDICSEDFEALLHYMYIGEVNVVQERLAGLIKAAECLQIKGLAVPDDGQSAISHKGSSPSRSKRSLQKSEQEISACRKKRKNSVSSAGNVSPNTNNNNKDDEALRSNSKTQNTSDQMPTSDDDRSTTISSKKRNSSKDTPTFDCDSGLQTNDTYINNSEINEVKIEPEETQQYLEAENVEDCKDALQEEYLQDNRDCTGENHEGPSLKSPQMEEIREWSNCVENAAFESSFPSSYDQHSVLSGTSFLSAISQLRSLSSTALSPDSPSRLQTSTPRSLPATTSSGTNSSLQSPSKNAKAFSCDTCSYATDVYHNLKIHLRTHTGERPYACPLCPYRGTQLFHVQRHMRTHTGEKPYACHLCQYKSNRKDHLTEHMLASHKVDYRTRSGSVN